MEGYFDQERAFCLVVQLLDMRHKPTQDDIGMISFYTIVVCHILWFLQSWIN